MSKISNALICRNVYQTWSISWWIPSCFLTSRNSGIGPVPMEMRQIAKFTDLPTSSLSTKIDVVIINSKTWLLYSMLLLLECDQTTVIIQGINSLHLLYNGLQRYQPCLHLLPHYRLIIPQLLIKHITIRTRFHRELLTQVSSQTGSCETLEGGGTLKTGRTTKEWLFFSVFSYAFVNDSLNSCDWFFTLRRRAVAVKARPL